MPSSLGFSSLFEASSQQLSEILKLLGRRGVGGAKQRAMTPSIPFHVCFTSASSSSVLLPAYGCQDGGPLDRHFFASYCNVQYRALGYFGYIWLGAVTVRMRTSLIRIGPSHLDCSLSSPEAVTTIKTQKHLPHN